MNIVVKENIIPSLNDLLVLYNNVGWVNYTKNPEMLQKSYENSLLVLSAWINDKLVGLIRIVGDGYSIIYIQDILVLKEYQGMGIGTKLLTEALNKYKDVYQKVLLTDNSPKTISFYEKMGFVTSDKWGCVSLLKS